MKNLRSIIHGLTLALVAMLFLPDVALSAARRKGAKPKVANTKNTRKTSNRSNKSATKASRKKVVANPEKKRRGKGRQKARYNRVYREVQYVDYAIRREEMRRQDSIRLRSGGTEPIPRMGQSVKTIANAEPQLLRFRRADSTLSMRTIETLYFTRQEAADDSLFFRQIIPKVDAAIEKGKYKEALSLAEKGLFRNPMHIGLLKRACDLAQHEGSNDLDTYIWQISELLTLIQHTGEGKSPETAWRVMEFNDALLYEMLWLGTEQTHILSRKTSTHKGQTLLTLSVQGKKGKTEEHYYIVGKAKALK